MKLLLVLALGASLISGFVFALSYVLNAVPTNSIQGIGQSDPVFGWNEFVDLLQIGVAACAVIIAPGLLSRLSDRVRGRVVAECKPLAFDPHTGTRAWRIFLSSSARHLDDLTISIYPRSQGNTIVTSRARTAQDGGTRLSNAGGSGLSQPRDRPLRSEPTSRFLLLFERADEPAFHSAQVAVRVKKPNYDEILRVSGHRLYLMRFRIVIVLSGFAFIFIVLMVRLMLLA